MKNIFIILALCGAVAAQAATYSFSNTPNLAIPDDDPDNHVNVQNSIGVTGFGAGAYITHVNVSLNLVGATSWNGDVAAYLVGPQGQQVWL